MEEEQHESREWESMPLDCLVGIFSLLDLDDLTASIAFVCRSWSRAAADPSCCRFLDFRRIDLNPSNLFSKRLAAQLSLPRFTFSGFLKHALSRSRRAAYELHFSPLCPPSMEVLSLASTQCPELKALGLPRIALDDEEHLFELIGAWKDPERLEMQSKPSKLGDIAARIGLRCGRFQGLKIRGSINKEEALGIVGSLPKIRFLDLSVSRIGREESLAIVDGCRELKRLSVKECVGFEADEEVKRRAVGIEVFEHEGCEVKNGSSIDPIDQDDAIFEDMFMYYDDCFEMWML